MGGLFGCVFFSHIAMGILYVLPVHGCMGVCVHGSMSVWECVCLWECVWEYECVGVSLREYEYVGVCMGV